MIIFLDSIPTCWKLMNSFNMYCFLYQNSYHLVLCLINNKVHKHCFHICMKRWRGTITHLHWWMEELLCVKSSVEFSNSVHIMFTNYNSYTVLLGFFSPEWFWQCNIYYSSRDRYVAYIYHVKRTVCVCKASPRINIFNDIVFLTATKQRTGLSLFLRLFS